MVAALGVNQCRYSRFCPQPCQTKISIGEILSAFEISRLSGIFYDREVDAIVLGAISL
jgi:hypothetical protein